MYSKRETQSMVDRVANLEISNSLVLFNSPSLTLLSLGGVGSHLLPLQFQHEWALSDSASSEAQVLRAHLEKYFNERKQSQYFATEGFPKTLCIQHSLDNLVLLRSLRYFFGCCLPTRQMEPKFHFQIRPNFSLLCNYY